ncbi:MAG TPA: hypothetical protein VM910_16420 [Bradyrhizobium sp.]|nr:hypothetical protein [Bradyrhizobium sp.]
MSVKERTILLYDTPDYVGERIEVKGSSANVAAKHWVEAARFRGN